MAWLSRSGHRNLHHRSHFDGAVAGPGDAPRDANGFVEILGFDQVVAAKLLARFGKGTVCYDRLLSRTRTLLPVGVGSRGAPASRWPLD